jgi:hypothetical protein
MLSPDNHLRVKPLRRFLQIGTFNGRVPHPPCGVQPEVA